MGYGVSGVEWFAEDVATVAAIVEGRVQAVGVGGLLTGEWSLSRSADGSPELRVGVAPVPLSGDELARVWSMIERDADEL